MIPGGSDMGLEAFTALPAVPGNGLELEGAEPGSAGETGAVFTPPLVLELVVEPVAMPLVPAPALTPVPAPAPAPALPEPV